jgi:hypothetical protein
MLGQTTEMTSVEIDTPRGKAKLMSAGMAPQFTKWNAFGFPIEWIGSLAWKLVFDDGAVCMPNEDPRLVAGDRR